MSSALQIVLNGIMLSSTYVLIALGLTLVFGVMRIINFAHGEFYMLGAFVVYYAVVKVGLNYFLALLLSMLAVGLLGVVVERVLFRPIRTKMMSTVMLALGLSIVIQEFSRMGFGINDKYIPSIFGGDFRILGATMTGERLAVIVGSLVCLGLLYFVITRTRFGRAMRAVQQDAEAAALQGVSLGQVSSMCMMISGALAAVAGGLLGPVFYISPYMGVTAILKAFIIIVLGGIGSLPGAVLGGFVLGFSESLSTAFIGASSSLLIGFVLLFLIMLVRPYGLMGHEE